MQPDQLFTLQSFGTLAGAAGAVTVLTNTFRRLVGINSLYVPFGFSLLVSAVGAYVAQTTSGVGWVVMVLNACLLFCTASGIQEAAIKGAEPAGLAKTQGRQRLPWLSSWFR